MTAQEMQTVKDVLRNHLAGETVEQIASEITRRLDARKDPSRPGCYPGRMQKGEYLK